MIPADIVQQRYYMSVCCCLTSCIFAVKRNLYQSIVETIDWITMNDKYVSLTQWINNRLVRIFFLFIWQNTSSTWWGACDNKRRHAGNIPVCSKERSSVQPWDDSWSYAKPWAISQKVPLYAENCVESSELQERKSCGFKTGSSRRHQIVTLDQHSWSRGAWKHSNQA